MKALVLVDLQKDFLPGGPLGVPEGDAVLPVVNRLATSFDLVVATQDWHPSDHGSFASSHQGKSPGDHVELAGQDQILWPDHCIQETEGAAFAEDLDLRHVDATFKKGIDPDIDSYSAFFDNGKRRATGLEEYLRDHGVDAVYVAGLATDYCVKFTALDAVECGFETTVVEDACRGVDLEKGDSERALEAMQEAGVRLVRSDRVEQEVQA